MRRGYVGQHTSFSPRVSRISQFVFRIFSVGATRRSWGSQTTLRTYWNNPYTAMVSDIPTEAKLEPANWGLFRLVANEEID